MYVVELEQGVWLAPWEGDPGRTLVKAFALVYETYEDARFDLEAAKRYRPFEDAKIQEI